MSVYDLGYGSEGSFGSDIGYGGSDYGSYDFGSTTGYNDYSYFEPSLGGSFGSDYDLGYDLGSGLSFGGGSGYSPYDVGYNLGSGLSPNTDYFGFGNLDQPAPSGGGRFELPSGVENFLYGLGERYIGGQVGQAIGGYPGLIASLMTRAGINAYRKDTGMEGFFSNLLRGGLGTAVSIAGGPLAGLATGFLYDMFKKQGEQTDFRNSELMRLQNEAFNEQLGLVGERNIADMNYYDELQRIQMQAGERPDNYNPYIVDIGGGVSGPGGGTEYLDFGGLSSSGIRHYGGDSVYPTAPSLSTYFGGSQSMGGDGGSLGSFSIGGSGGSFSGAGGGGGGGLLGELYSANSGGSFDSFALGSERGGQYSLVNGVPVGWPYIQGSAINSPQNISWSLSPSITSMYGQPGNLTPIPEMQNPFWGETASTGTSSPVTISYDRTSYM